MRDNSSAKGNRRNLRVHVDNVIADNGKDEDEQKESFSTVAHHIGEHSSHKTTKLVREVLGVPGARWVSHSSCHDSGSQPLDKDKGDDKTSIGPGEDLPRGGLSRLIDVVITVRNERIKLISENEGDERRCSAAWKLTWPN